MAVNFTPKDKTCDFEIGGSLVGEITEAGRIQVHSSSFHRGVAFELEDAELLINQARAMREKAQNPQE